MLFAKQEHGLSIQLKQKLRVVGQDSIFNLKATPDLARAFSRRENWPVLATAATVALISTLANHTEAIAAPELDSTPEGDLLPGNPDIHATLSSEGATLTLRPETSAQHHIPAHLLNDAIKNLEGLLAKNSEGQYKPNTSSLSHHSSYCPINFDWPGFDPVTGKCISITNNFGVKYKVDGRPLWKGGPTTPFVEIGPGRWVPMPVFMKALDQVQLGYTPSPDLAPALATTIPELEPTASPTELPQTQVASLPAQEGDDPELTGTLVATGLVVGGLVVVGGGFAFAASKTRSTDDHADVGSSTPYYPAPIVIPTKTAPPRTNCDLNEEERAAQDRYLRTGGVEQAPPPKGRKNIFAGLSEQDAADLMQNINDDLSSTANYRDMALEDYRAYAANPNVKHALVDDFEYGIVDLSYISNPEDRPYNIGFTSGYREPYDPKKTQEVWDEIGRIHDEKVRKEREDRENMKDFWHREKNND